MAAFGPSHQADTTAYRFREAVSGACSGRSLVATRSLRRGEVILYEECCTFAPIPALAEVCCNYCGIVCTGETLYRLSSEDIGRYCSEECITVDYALHQHEVDALGKLAPIWVEKLGLEIFRTLIRVACLKKMYGSYGTGKSAPKLGRENFFTEIMTLEAATGLLPQSTIIGVRSLADSFAKALRSTSELRLSATEIERLMFIIQCNAHKIVTENDRSLPIGLGVFPMTCMMNHSCAPNCAHRFIVSSKQPPRLVMQAISDIAEGEELCYSYVPLYQSTIRRREQLRSAYSFECDCPRCSDSILTSADVYIDDDPAGNAGRERVIKEIEVCINLANCDDCSRIAMSLKKLLSILQDASKISRFHVWCKTLLQAYVSISKSAVKLLCAESNVSFAAFFDDNTLRTLPSIAFSFGALSAGCIGRFTRVSSVEIGECCELMLRAVVSQSGQPADSHINIVDEVILKTLENHLCTDSEEIRAITQHFACMCPSADLRGVQELCRLNFESKLSTEEISARIRCYQVNKE